MQRKTITTDELVFVAFNSRVFAVDRADGAIIWRWKSTVAGASGMPMLLPSDDRLIVSISGYTWALDLTDGRELWFQPFKGEGTGIPMLATARVSADAGSAGAAAAAAASAAAAAAAGAMAASTAAAAASS